MIEEIKNIKSGRRELRQFGITVGIVLGLLGCFFIWRQKEWCYYFIIISFVFLLFGLVLPLLLKPVHKVWMTLAIFMGWCMTGVILGVLFYLVVTPIGLLMRLCGNDFFDINTGLIRIARGYGYIFSPTDFFNPKDPLNPNARPEGKLSLVTTFYPADMWKIEAFIIQIASLFVKA